jgi:hypothetical protein
MKIVAFFFITLLCSATIVKAQLKIDVTTEQRPSSEGIKTAFEVRVPQATSNEAVDLWKKKLELNKLLRKTPKMEKVKDEWIVNDVIINDITPLPLKVIMQVSSFSGQIFVRFFIQNEVGFMGTPGTSEYNTRAAINYIHDYAVELYKLAVLRELKTEETKLKMLEKERKKLFSKNNSYNNKLSDAKTEQINLSENTNYKRENLDTSIGNSMNKSDDDEHINIQKQLKSNNKMIKKAEKNESKFIRKAEKNERALLAKVREIKLQKIKIGEIKTIYDNIR